MAVLVDVHVGEVQIESPFHDGWTRAGEVVQTHPLWGDAFMRTLEDAENKPKLAWGLVVEWTRQMYHGSLVFPRYVGNLIGRVRNHAAGRLLAINAATERGYPEEDKSHFLLAANLLRTMGLRDEEIVSLPCAPASAAYIDGHLAYTRNAPLEHAVGLLGLGIEALTTREFTYLGHAFLRTASREGGLQWDTAYQEQGYFGENIGADKQHQVDFEKIAYLLWLAKEICPDLGTTMEGIQTGALYSLDLRRQFFDDIYKRVTQNLTPQPASL